MKIIKNNNHNILFVFLAILFVFTVIINVPNVDATNYTVDTNGNDSAGGISSPFKSVGRAIDVTNNGVGGDNITINAGTYKSSEGHNVSNLTISKNVNIYSAKYLGKSGLDTILDGEKKGWFFYINPGVTVNIYGIIFKNGNGTLGGGISSDRGVCNLNNVSFINCTSASGGGAIYVGDGSINIIASNFENNTVGQDSSGGAIYVDGGSVNLIACNFTANNANAGGAVFIFTNNNVEIVDCIFKNNVANNNGGAILFFKSNNVRVSNSSFTNNNGYVGGAIRIEDSNVDVIACNFTVNYVNSVGGAICIEGGNVKLSDSIFTGNKGNVGGAVLIWEGNNVNLINCTFEYNTANYGGAVCVEDDNVNIINSTFNENNASIAGGAIYIGANNVKVSGSNFTGNIANGADYGGGAICVDDGNIEVINSSFIGNRGKYGGAIFMANYNVKVSGSIFIGNNAEYGGAIFVNSGTCTINYSIILNNTNNQIYRNNNGIIFADYNWWANHNNPQSQVFGFELNNWFVMGLNKVTTEVSVGGNFVFNYHFSLFNKVYGTTSFNAGVGNFPHFDFILTYNGAVIHLSDTDARFNKTGLTVVVNKTIGNTITASAFNREITHLSFEAIRHRTAIVVQDTNGNYGENIVLRANLSFFNPNAIPLNNKTVNFYVNGAYVGSNVTNSSGIAIFNYIPNIMGNFNWRAEFAGDIDYNASTSSNSRLNIVFNGDYYRVDTNGNDAGTGTDTNPFKSLSRAISQSNGGGHNTIFINPGLYKTSLGHNLNNLHITRNVSIYGAKYFGSDRDTILDGEGLYSFFTIANGVTVNIYGIVFTNGRSTGNGGAISSERGFCNLKDVAFINCNSDSNGGAIFARNANNWSFVNVVFENCNAKGNGGVIYADTCNIWSFVNVTFLNSAAGGVGGAIYSTGSENWYFNSTEFVNCVSSGGSDVIAGGSSNTWSFTNVSHVTKIVANEINSIYGQNVVLTATLTSNGKGLSNSLVYFYVNGQLVGTNRTGANGVAIYTYRPNVANAMWYAYYNGTDNLGITYKASSSSNLIFFIDKIDTIHTLSNIVASQGQTVVLTTTLSHNSGPLANQLVSFFVNNVFIGNAITDGNGVARFNYRGSAGNYIWTASYYGNEFYKSTLGVANLFINKIVTKVSLSRNNIKCTYGKNVILSATLHDSNGKILANKVIDLFFNGIKVGTSRTDNKGFVAFSYKVSLTGILLFSFRYAGDSEYVSSSANMGLDVKRHSNVVINNKVKRSKSSSTLSSSIKNNGPNALTGKITYKFAKGVNPVKVTGNLGKFKLNKKSRTITFDIKDLNRGTRSVKFIITINANVKGKRFVTNKVTSKNTLSVRLSNK